MTKVLVLYYSSYGHIEQMAYAVAEGAREVAGVEAVVKRVPELVPEEVAKQSHFKLDQPAPVATPAELADYDAIIVGTPTRFGNMTAQMRNFWDQTGGLWMNGALVGKVGSVFASSATQHGGNETTIITTIPTLLHQGLMAWAALFGTVSFELFGQLHGIIGEQPGDHEAYFAESVRRWAAQLGITPAGTAPAARKPTRPLEPA